MSPQSLPRTFRYFNSGGLATAFFGVFIVMALSGLSRALTSVAGLPASAAMGLCGALGAAALTGLYFFFSTELLATVSAEGMVVTSQSRLGPLRGKLDTILDVRWSAVSVVHDVTASSITKHGNVQKTYKLKIGGETFEGAMLGTMGRDGLYLELIEAVRLAVGDKLVSTEDLGELDGAVRRVVAERSDERRGSRS